VVSSCQPTQTTLDEVEILSETLVHFGVEVGIDAIVDGEQNPGSVPQVELLGSCVTLTIVPVVPFVI